MRVPYSGSVFNISSEKRSIALGFYLLAAAADVTSQKGTGGVYLLGYDVDVFVPSVENV